MKLLVLWVTPSEEARATLFTRVQDDFALNEQNAQDMDVMYFGKASCCQPKFVMSFPDDVNIPHIFDWDGDRVDPDHVVGPLP